MKRDGDVYTILSRALFPVKGTFLWMVSLDGTFPGLISRVAIHTFSWNLSRETLDESWMGVLG